MSKIVAIIGSYRKGGTIDSAVEAVLAGARSKGTETTKLYLTDLHVEFCTNCRSCTQSAGEERGKCVQQDDLQLILREVESADAIVLGSPVNCYNVTAIFRRMMERLIGASYWPWGQAAPAMRTRKMRGKALLVASAAMPGVMIPVFTGARKALRLTAQGLGFKPAGSLLIGLAASSLDQPVSARTLRRAHLAGMRLV
jgi:NAD(P)H-dependent FMN reductase